MRFTGRVESIMEDLSTRKQKIILTVNEDVRAEYNKLKDCDKLSVEVKKYRAKRSLDANAYAWVLMTKIAEALNTDKDAVYEQMLRDYGFAYEDDSGVGKKLTVLKSINPAEFGLHVKYIGDGHVGGKVFAHYLVIRGSSEYDTREMSYFIERIIDEAKQLGIETIPPHELERMMNVYEKHHAG